MISLRSLLRSTLGRFVAGAAVGLLSTASSLAQGTPRYLPYQTVAAAAPSGYGFPQANMATDKFGNLYLSDIYASRVYEIPADGSAAKTIFTDTTYAAIGGISIDPAGALYVTLVYHVTTATDSGIYRLPPTSGGFAPYTFTGVAPAQCTAGATSVCTYGAFYQPAGSSFGFGLSTAFDGSGNGYYISTYDALGGGGKDIFACNAACAAATANATVAVANLATKAVSIAAAPNGDLYWTDGNDIFFSKSGSGGINTFDKSLEAASPKGVGFDRAGNLYASTGNGTYEYPGVNGLIAAGTISQVSNQYSGPVGPAIGNNGEVYTGEYGAIQKTYRFAANAGSSPVGTAGTAITVMVNYNVTGTFASLVALGTGGAPSTEFVISGDGCTGNTQAPGGSCSFNVTLTPASVGMRRATAVLTDQAGNVTNVSLSGIGTGTGVPVDPGTPTTVSTTVAQPSGIAADAGKNLYVTSASGGTVTRFSSGTTTGTVIASGLKTPTGVAVDGAGNLLVVEQAGNDLLQFARSATTATGFAAAPTVLASGLKAPTDVVVSGSGVIFVSNTGAQEVRQYPNSSLLPYLAEYSSYGASLGAPAGLSVDANGNLFVADTANNQVAEISAAGVQSIVGSGLNAPTGVAAEASGSIIIADQGNGRLVRVPYEAAGLTTTDQVALPQPVINPYSVRVTADGTLYLSDNVANNVVSLSRTAGTVNFGVTNVNTTSAAQSIIVSSTGTAPLTLGSPFYAPVPASSSFTLTAGSVGTPCAAGTLNAGSSCSLSSTFKPTATGTQTYAVPFNTTSNNASAPGVTLTGRGVQLAAVTVTVSQTPAGSINYGSSVKLSATVASSGTTTGTPTGTLVFTVDGNASKAITLTAGAASTTLTGLSSGSHSVVASYSGDGTFASGVSPVFTVTVNPGTTLGTLAITGTGLTPLSASVTDAVSFAVTITPSIAGTLSGTVTFYNGSTVLGTAPVSQTIPAGTTGYPTGQYAANFAFAPTTATPTPAGVYQVYAVFTPAANYTGFTTPVQTLTIVTRPTYGITADTYNLTATSSTYGIANLTVSSYAGFQGGVSLTCTGLPANAYCIFRPGVVSLVVSGTSIPQQVTQMQIRAYQNPVDIQSASGFGIAGAAVAVLVLLVLGRGRRPRQLLGGSLALIALSMTVSMMTACGTGSTTASQYPTPAGTYSVSLQSVATPIVSGQAPSVFAVARIQVTAGTSGNTAHVIVNGTPPQYQAGTQIQIAQSTTSAVNGIFTVTGTSTVTTVGDPYLGSQQLDLAAGSLAVGTTATDGQVRQTNSTIASQIFTLVVK